jgi:FAD/FMN-containing dehydrogenase
MEIHGWGRYPRIMADIFRPRTASACCDAIRGTGSLIARGLGRSYGDSSLAPKVLDTCYLDHFLAFDEASGVLTCSAGASLAAILRVFVPKGWFLPVTPGTRLITIGGAIASDVHGKNHHVDGTFARHVDRIELLLGNGDRVVASPRQERALFQATCGGMGLTGVILSAAIQLKPIRGSDIIETTVKAPSLDAVLDAFEENATAAYSVAWIDCLARGRNLGRSLLMLGEHATDGTMAAHGGRPLPVPFTMPANLLNRVTAKAFNALFYQTALPSRRTRRVPFEPFFYPLDKLGDWNRLYGKAGFVQYQFVLPKAAGAAGLRDVLERIARSGRGSFLAVLKAFGPANEHHLSFPMEGYTLALDFKAEPPVFQLLDELDSVILNYGGRLYLAKDARMTEATFKASYPRWPEFEQVRAQYHALGKFASRQSQRLGLQ